MNTPSVLTEEEKIVIKKILLQPAAKFKYRLLKRFIPDYEIREAPISFVFELVKFQLGIKDSEMSYQSFYFGFRKYRKNLVKQNIETSLSIPEKNEGEEKEHNSDMEYSLKTETGMSIKSIYISGAVRGLEYEDAIKNFARKQTELEAEGYSVINPLEKLIAYNNRLRLAGGKPLNEYTDRTQILKMDIQLLLNCDAIYMLRDWESSQGATMEHHIASTLGLKIMYETNRAN
jgi:hypothetical protein